MSTKTVLRFHVNNFGNGLDARWVVVPEGYPEQPETVRGEYGVSQLTEAGAKWNVKLKEDGHPTFRNGADARRCAAGLTPAKMVTDLIEKLTAALAEHKGDDKALADVVVRAVRPIERQLTAVR